VTDNHHWDSFAEELSWFLTDRHRLEVGALVRPGGWRASSRFREVFPTLARLLEAAHTSHVGLDDGDYCLFSWEGRSWISSWLAPPPAADTDAALLPDHRVLLAEFGGITERSGHPDGSWLLNANVSLIGGEERADASFIRDYAWAFEGVSGGIPIVLEDYYPICWEANGNATLCHRTTGDVLLFAPDHSFDDVTPLEGCPPYTLYRRAGGRTFVEWVETVAHQWTAAL
jgi:hypothetical protein